MEEKLFYNIKDVAEFVGESPSTLRYWEGEFNELNPIRTPKGRRQYTPQNIETIRKIKFLLRTKGMHIDAAKEQLRRNNKNISTRSEAIAQLEELQKQLELLLKSLNKIK